MSQIPKEVASVLEGFEKYEREQSESLERAKKQVEQAKDTVLQHLKTSGVAFVCIGSRYYSLKTVRPQAPLNTDLLRMVYRIYRKRISGQDASEGEIEGFISLVEEARVKLGTPSTKLVCSKTKPITSLVM